MSEDEGLDWRTLAREMSEISEQAFCAGWMDELEYRLWEIVHEGPRKYGQIALTDGQVTRLRDLSNELRGWVRFNDESEVEEFVESERWQNLYEEWLTRGPAAGTETDARGRR
jgi:hypothetical protein